MATAAGPLVKDLRSIAGRDNALPPKAGDFAVDGLAPAAVVRPGSYDEVAAVMRYVNENGLAIIVRGGGTMMHIGNVPRHYDIAVDLRRLDRITEHEPADLTVTCQAGISLGALRKHMATAGQVVPLDPSFAPEATVGGVLAAGASGPSRLAYGVPRDFTIGLKVVTADGRITKTGGRVVKNVAGYDLCKLYIGSLGTLAVIVEATFKVIPRSSIERGVALGFLSAADACAFASELHCRGLSLRAVELMNPAAATACGLETEGAYVMTVDLAGTKTAVDHSLLQITQLAGASQASIFGENKRATGHQSRAATRPALVCRSSSVPARLPELIAAVENTSVDVRIAAQPLAGVLHAAWTETAEAEALLRRLRELATHLGAPLVVEHCPLEIKRRIDVFGEPPPSFPLMRRIKEQFDPNGTLSPGRFLGGL